VQAGDEFVSRDTKAITFAGLPTVNVTGDESKISDPILVSQDTFNAVSITIKFVSGAAPNIVPRLQLQSPIDGTYTELHFDPILTWTDLAVTTDGTYIFDVRFPIVARLKLHLDGDAGNPSTTVTASITFQ
jgi:hypothetical protein